MSRPDQIRDLQKTWDRLGRADPMWAVASERDRWSQEEFFSTGAVEIADAMAYIEGLDVDLERRRAMDFGCGLGRLTRALSHHFPETVGVDIAPSMVQKARDLNRDLDNVMFVLNERPDLDSFDPRSFDLIYSNITLQHMRPELTASYIRGFLRVVSDSGLVLFQLPSRMQSSGAGLGARLGSVRREGPLRSFRALTRRLFLPSMEMHCIARDEVVGLVRDAGGEVRDVQANSNAGGGYESFTYAVTLK